VRRVFYDALLSAGALTLLLLVLIAIDDRVREQIALRFTDGHTTAQLAGATTQVQDLYTVIADVARQQSLEHAPLMLFAMAGTVLVMFMVRT
jgi:hypothetical protein